MYEYECPVCDAVEVEFCMISQYQSEIPCPRCDDGTMMLRIFGKAPHTSSTPFQHPIEMYSVAPNNPAELTAFRQRNPDVKLNDQLVPIARSRQEKLQILRNEGFEEKN